MSDQHQADANALDPHESSVILTPSALPRTSRRRLISGGLLGVLCGMLLGGGGVWAWSSQQQHTIAQAYQRQIDALQVQVARREHVEYNLDVATTQYPPQADCKLHSINDTQMTTLAFRNTSQRQVFINWLNYQGEEESFGSLLPGEVLIEQTFVTHPWCIRDSAHTIILSMTAVKEPQVVLIH